MDNTICFRIEKSNTGKGLDIYDDAGRLCWQAISVEGFKQMLSHAVDNIVAK